MPLSESNGYDGKNRCYCFIKCVLALLVNYFNDSSLFFSKRFITFMRKKYLSKLHKLRL